jgi:hypothetical protein
MSTGIRNDNSSHIRLETKLPFGARRCSVSFDGNHFSLHLFGPVLPHEQDHPGNRAFFRGI